MIISYNPNEYITLESVLERIEIAESLELWDIAEVLEARFQECFPDSEFRFLGLPRDLKQQIEYLERYTQMLKDHTEL